MPSGAFRSATAWVIVAVGPERWLCPVTDSRSCVTPARFTDADQVVVPTLAVASWVPVVALLRTTEYVVASVAAFQVALTRWLAAGFVTVMASPVTGPGLTGGLARAGPGAETASRRPARARAGAVRRRRPMGDMVASVSMARLDRTRTQNFQGVVSTTRGPA